MISNFNVLLNDSNLNVMMYDIKYINDNYKKMNINDFIDEIYRVSKDNTAQAGVAVCRLQPGQWGRYWG